MNFLESYNQAIALQQKRQSEEFEEQMALPLSERVRKGVTMINLSVDFDFYDGEPNDYCKILEGDLRYIKLARVHCFANLSKFREGSSVCLSYGEYRFKMDIVQDSVFDFVLAPSFGEVEHCFIEATNYPHHNWQIDDINSNVTYKLLVSTGQWLEKNSKLTTQISELIDGNYTPNILPIHYKNDTLNASQNEAIARSLGTDYVHLIQGPPGTGKTHTIGFLCQQLLSQGCTVFISGPTHTAINNCLLKIAEVVDDASKVVKIGDATNLSGAKITRKNRLTLQEYKNSILYCQEAIAIGATPYALCYPNAKKLDQWTFDYAIVDEAAQLSIPMAVAVLAKCRHVIFVGDHQQLSPIIPSDCDNVLFACSIFQHLATHYPKNLTMLNQSYRLNPHLLKNPNQLFYKGLLESDVAVNNDFVNFHCHSAHAQVVTHPASALLFLHEELDGIGHSPYEAAVVSDIVSDLLANEVPLNQIGILTPYRAQVREILQTVYQRGVLPAEEMENLFVDTVDRMQGQERDYVIYTLANTNPMEVEQRLEFFYNANRLNVAITRARVKCIVIANAKIFQISRELMQDETLNEELHRGVVAFTQFHDQSEIIHFNPLDDSDVWM